MPDCFIIMPITTPAEYVTLRNDADHFSHVLQHLFIPAVQSAGYNPISPVAAGSDVIQAEIIRRLETSDLVLCDISSLNPNVFFELGIRTAVDKPIAIVKDNTTARIPFDTAIVNVLTYDPSLAPWVLGNEIERISNHLSEVINRSEGRNTLWRYFGLTTRAAFPQAGSSEQSKLEEKVDLLLLQLQGTLRSRPQDISRPEPTMDSAVSVQQIVGVAQSILSENKAGLVSYVTTENRIIFDFNGYHVNQGQRRRITELADNYGFTVEFLGGHGPTEES